MIGHSRNVPKTSLGPTKEYRLKRRSVQYSAKGGSNTIQAGCTKRACQNEVRELFTIRTQTDCNGTGEKTEAAQRCADVDENP